MGGDYDAPRLSENLWSGLLSEEPPLCPCGHYDSVHRGPGRRCVGWSRTRGWSLFGGRIVVNFPCGCRRRSR